MTNLCRLFVGLICLIGTTVEAARAESLDTGQQAGAIFPGQPGVREFWNQHAQRFIYPPAFNVPEVAGAIRYRCIVETATGESKTFTAAKPWAALTPLWADLPEGYTRLTVHGIDAAGNAIGPSGERAFYRSPAFDGSVEQPIRPYAEAGRLGLKGVCSAGHVRQWLRDAKPDRSYGLYSYPSKVMGGLVRATVMYSRIADNQPDRTDSLEIARRVADYLIAISIPAGSPLAHFPPTYSIDVDKPNPAARSRFRDHWLMVPSPVDAALGYLDLYDATKDARCLQAAQNIADTYVRNQEQDGTWPLMVDSSTGQAVRGQRVIPTWIMLLLDRLDATQATPRYRGPRQKAWQWIVDHPLRTWQWDGQFEDVTPHPPYVNLAREQACDVAVLLLAESAGNSGAVAQAEELLRFAEDQFVVWSPIKDPAGWVKAMPKRRGKQAQWITPCVLEQYVCYGPVARSSAVLIGAYLKAHQVTGKAEYLAKARALANGLVAGQEYQMQNQGGNGEVPTWLIRDEPINWLNNSFYAAEALLKVSQAESKR